MDSDRIIKIVRITLILVGVIIILIWLSYDPTRKFTESLPGMDNRGKGDSLQNVKIGEYFQQFSTSFVPMNETWPRFRGSDFDNISKSNIRLKEKFGPGGPKIIWSHELGEGHSGAAIYKGQVYLMDYMEKEHSDMLRCFSLADGKELWRRGYKVNIKRNHGMSRTIPAVTENHVLTVGPRGHVMCVERTTGNLLWGIDLEKVYQVELPQWWTAQCPLIDNNLAILAPAGKSLMIAVDCNTGQIIWETPNPNQWTMSHSSIMPFTFGGRKMYVYSAVGGICGVAADGSDAGKILWESSKWNHSVVAPSPVCMPDGKIFLTAGYGAGSMVLQLRAASGNFTAEVMQEYLPKDGLACEQQSPVYWNGHLFGIMPKDGGPNRNLMVCVNPSDCKKFVWVSDKETRFGLGPYMIADNKFYVLDDEGTLTIVKPSTSRYIQLDRFKIIPEGQDAWAPLAVADGYMVLRDSKTMVCIDMRL